MAELPKITEVKRLGNNLLLLTFNHEMKKALHLHFIDDLGVQNLLGHHFFGLLGIGKSKNQFKIEPDGTLIVNETDVYTPEELWKNSEPYHKKKQAQIFKAWISENQLIDVWQVDENVELSGWVAKAFEKGQLFWQTENNETLLMKRIRAKENQVCGKSGEYLIFDRETRGYYCISEKYFDKKYRKMKEKIMEAKFENENVEVWEISRESRQLDWVNTAFFEKKIYWAEEIATNFSENLGGSWLNDHKSPVYRITDSKSANYLVLEQSENFEYGKFGMFLLKKLDGSLHIADANQIEF